MTTNKGEHVADIDLEQGIIWAYRLLLFREPESPEVVAAHLAGIRRADDIRPTFMATAEYRDRYETIGRPQQAPTFPVDLREGVLWGYRFLLGREPSDEHVDYQLTRVRSIQDVRSIFVLCREFELIEGNAVAELRDLEILNRFAPFHAEPAEPGWFHDFLGTKTRISYLPTIYHHKSGTVEGGPGSRTRGMHGIAEWTGTLRSVIEAREKFVAVELGAGWAPWLVSSAFAARKMGIDDIRLIGVEASPEHVGFSRQHLADNGLGDRGEIIHAVVGEEDGVARFPKLVDPSDHYGAHAAFDPEDAKPAPGFGEWEEIPSVSMETLLADVPFVDILHCDIQGAETRVFTRSIMIMNERVRRAVIGTHSRKIEGELIDLFSANGWVLEYELPCVIKQLEHGPFHVLVDGEQVWRNGRHG